MRIAFVHPDLGIGGAERLVLDAAVGLQKLGHEIVIYTSHRDKTHCFDEARDGTLEVRVRGNTLFPSNIYGRFAILCAMLRQLHLAITLIRDTDHFDAIFIDQLSTAIPLLRLYLNARILFYCHFPDKLLSSRTNILKSIYRVPFDLIEELTTSQADAIVVNSNFTASIFKQSFPRIQTLPKVVYPCVDVHKEFANLAITTGFERKIVLSINRFERKKDLALAIRAFALLKAHKNFDSAVLVLAGGYDERVRENVEYHVELQRLSTKLSLTHETMKAPYDLSTFKIQAPTNVCFLLSIPGELKGALLGCAHVLAYTPMHEHFGIVPIEASLAKTPVLAQNNGGPLETVEDGVTGFLRPADEIAWSKVLEKVLFDMTDENRKQLGNAGRKKVLETFSQETMAETLNDEFEGLVKRARVPQHDLYAMALLALLLVGLWKWAMRPIVSVVWHGRV